jgi:hypothetical protein
MTEDKGPTRPDTKKGKTPVGSQRGRGAGLGRVQMEDSIELMLNALGLSTVAVVTSRIE